MTIRTVAEGRANSPNSGTGTVTELSAELTPPSKNNVMSFPPTKLTRKRIRCPTETSTPALFGQLKNRSAPPVVAQGAKQMRFGDNPLVSVIMNSISRVVPVTYERSSEAVQSPVGMLSCEVAGSVKKQATSPDVNRRLVPPSLP